MKLSCDMDLWKFPFDSQLCYMAMESCEFPRDNVRVWADRWMVGFEKDGLLDD